MADANDLRHVQIMRIIENEIRYAQEHVSPGHFVSEVRVDAEQGSIDSITEPTSTLADPQNPPEPKRFIVIGGETKPFDEALRQQPSDPGGSRTKKIVIGVLVALLILPLSATGARSLLRGDATSNIAGAQPGDNKIYNPSDDDPVVADPPNDSSQVTPEETGDTESPVRVIGDFVDDGLTDSSGSDYQVGQCLEPYVSSADTSPDDLTIVDCDSRHQSQVTGSEYISDTSWSELVDEMDSSDDPLFQRCADDSQELTPPANRKLLWGFVTPDEDDWDSEPYILCTVDVYNSTDKMIITKGQLAPS